MRLIGLLSEYVLTLQFQILGLMTQELRIHYCPEVIHWELDLQILGIINYGLSINNYDRNS